MESFLSKTDQLKQIIHQLEKLNFSEETYFSFKRADELDEFVQANKQGLIDFSKSLLNAAVEKEGAYGMLDYDVLSINSCMKPTYVEFKTKEPRHVQVKTVKRFGIGNPLGFTLYLVGSVMGLACLVTGAYTILEYLMK